MKLKIYESVNQFKMGCCHSQDEDIITDYKSQRRIYYKRARRRSRKYLKNGISQNEKTKLYY
jgi:hypothetical protein